MIHYHIWNIPPENEHNLEILGFTKNLDFYEKHCISQLRHDYIKVYLK